MRVTVSVFGATVVAKSVETGMTLTRWKHSLKPLFLIRNLRVTHHLSMVHAKTFTGSMKWAAVLKVRID
jgi:hypothetical protein